MSRSIREILRQIASATSSDAHSARVLAECRELAAEALRDLDDRARKLDDRAREFTRRTCAECGERTLDDYMLHDVVWSQVARPGDRWLHLACAQARLGRPLERSDLPAVPINSALRFVLGQSAPVSACASSPDRRD